MASAYRLTKIKPKSHPIVSRVNRNELEEWNRTPSLAAQNSAGWRQRFEDMRSLEHRGSQLCRFGAMQFG